MCWWELRVAVPARDAEAVTDALAFIADDATFAVDLPFHQPTPEAPASARIDDLATVIACVRASDRTPAAREALRRRSNAALSSFGARVRVRLIRDADWAAASRAAFSATRIGERIVVVPCWERYDPTEGDLVVTLDTGVAFGTGEHPTTRTCLEEAERIVRPGMRVLDLGCGSGILAVAAAKLGAAHVWALDLDQFAVDAAVANVERNGLASDVTVLRGSLEDDPPGGLPPAFELILANIASAPLIALSSRLAGALAEGGTLVASGILVDEDRRAVPVVDAFASAGLAIERTVDAGNWRTIVATRPA